MEQESTLIKGKVDTKVILTYTSGEKSTFYVPRRYADGLLDAIADSIFDDIRTVCFLFRGKVGKSNG